MAGDPLLDLLPLRAARLGADRRHVAVNAAYALLLGQPAEAIVGRTIAEILGYEAHLQLAPLADRAAAGETAYWSGWLHFPGGDRYVVWHHAPVPGTADIYAFVQDVTEQVENERMTSALIEKALDCIIAIDDGGRVVEFNPAAERVFGYRRREALGRRIDDLIVPIHLRQAHRQGFARYLREGRSTMMGRRVEIEARSADGRLFPVELTLAEVALGERRLFTAYLRDLSGQRAAAAEIARQREILHRNDKLATLGALVTGVAHELNNPLSVVVGRARLLEETAAAGPLRIQAEKIRLAAERCGRIVRTFLGLARQRPPEHLPLDLNRLVEATLDLVADELRGSDIVLDLALAADLPQIRGDEGQLGQIVLNLVLNARSALGDIAGPRRLRISSTTDPDQVTLTVADNGPGVPPDLRQRIFEPFFTTKPPGDGSGVGLAVAAAIAEAHGGRLTLVTAGEPGAAFVLTLPR